MAIKRLLSALVSTDHRVVAKNYLWSGLAFLSLGGLLAMIMRWQWAFPGRAVPLVGTLLFADADGVVTAAGYASLFTNHGLIMIFFAVSPILIGTLSNLRIPPMVGAGEMASPRLSRAAFLVFLAAQVIAFASLFADAAANAGWTMYAPLSTDAGGPGSGQTQMMIALLGVGLASVLAAINTVVTIVAGRAPARGLGQLPLTAWGLFLTAILSIVFFPVLAAALVLALTDRLAGTGFFAIATGDPTIYQHLFWVFGHPEVYILILPVFGIVSDIIAESSGRPPSFYRGTVGAMIAITALSGAVYGHHLYQLGLGPLVGASFELFTLAISVPSVVIVANWMMTLHGGAIRLSVPMVLCLGTMFVFVAGGLTGLYLGAVTSDIYLHDSLWVVGHFHLIMAAATFLGLLAALTLWFPALFGRRLNVRLGMIHAVLTVALLAATFGCLLVAGYEGAPRRFFDPGAAAFVRHLGGLHTMTSMFAFTLGAVQLLFVANWFLSMRRGDVA